MPDSEAATTPPLTTSNLPIAGSRVRLRDITLEDADLLDAWAADPVARGEFNDFGTEQQLTDRAALAKGPYRNERNGQLIVSGSTPARRSARSAGARSATARPSSPRSGTSGSR